jgi:dTDP-4-dehydrorhamnose reductase
MTDVQTFWLDVTDKSATEQALRELNPDVILHTVALTNVDECESNPTLAHQINVEATQNIASIASELEAKMVHISTDQLFDGLEAWKTEDDVPTPLNVYGKTKQLAESAVIDQNKTSLVIRTNFFGWGLPPRSSFSDWILRGLDQRQELTMFTDVFFTPILIDHLVDTVFSLVEQNGSGIFNVVGADRLSKYDFAMQLADTFNYPTDKVRATSVSDFDYRAARPNDMSLSTEKLAQYLGRPVPRIADGLNQLYVSHADHGQ